ncbi:OsmC family protein [Demequina sp. B12]|uniref:OsmC family protein n=1 Tax=Demequina sp. B12 TaxID=2992757 RepID=UPI00237B4177|nr:OsmC family protein [Demequina sp. B12]MDE0572052.1 OsmC family protein [Demequina sp. B12]
MAEEITKKQVTLVREAEGVYVARNAEGAEYRFGYNVEGALSAVDLLLAAIAGCSATDLDMMTSRRAEPEHFTATVNADKVGGSTPAILRDIDVAFDVAFPEGADGDKARARIAAALKAAEEKTCTVSRTVVHGAEVTLREV